MSLKDATEVLQLFVGAATIVSLGLTIYNLRLARTSFRRQMNAQLYLAFTQRFEALMRDHAADFHAIALGADYAAIPEADRPRLWGFLVRYLNLCSEEYYLLVAGYLDAEIWAIWEMELVRTLRSCLYRTAWPALRAEFQSFPVFVSYVEQVQKGGAMSPQAG